MKRYVYFVSFFFTTWLSSGFSNVEIGFDQEIKRMDDIRKVEDKLKVQTKFKKVIVQNFQLLRTEEE